MKGVTAIQLKYINIHKKLREQQGVGGASGKRGLGRAVDWQMKNIHQSVLQVYKTLQRKHLQRKDPSLVKE